MRLYLAELTHDTQRTAGTVVPLASGYLAAAVQAAYPDVETTIFTDPHKLLTAVESRPPDVLGFSLHLWSERLSAWCAAEARRLAPDVFIVAGGPSVPRDDEGQATLLASSAYDVLVPGEGEIALGGLLTMVRGGQPIPRDATPGCMLSDLDALPSPYLTGWLDPFLAEGATPAVSSSRGCPYRCRFCVSGAVECSKLRPFPLDRVYAELAYIRTRTKSDTLILTDENLGILKRRDEELARHIRYLHDFHGWPAHLYAYTAKIVTEDVRQVIKALGPLAEFCQSFQTLHEPTRKAIGRTNQSQERFLANLAWAHERGILTSTEMIFGLPGETVDTYHEGLEWLLRSGVDRVYSYNLKLLNGSDLATQASRAQHQYQTRWRLPDRAYGRYSGQVVAEAEEVVVGSDTFTFDDYMATRRYGLWLEVVSGRGYLASFVQRAIREGLPGEKLVAFLAGYALANYPWLKTLLDGYHADACGELCFTPEECQRYAAGVLNETRPDPRAKLNLIYAEKLMGSPEMRAELLALVARFLQSIPGEVELRRVMQEYVLDVLPGELAAFEAKEYA